MVISLTWRSTLPENSWFLTPFHPPTHTVQLATRATSRQKSKYSAHLLGSFIHALAVERVFGDFGADDAGNNGAGMKADPNLKRMRRTMTNAERTSRWQQGDRQTLVTYDLHYIVHGKYHHGQRMTVVSLFLMAYKYSYICF